MTLFGESASSNAAQIDTLKSYCLALYMILAENDLVKNGEFPKYISRATHIIEQLEAEMKEKAIADMSEEEKKTYDVLSILFGRSNES